MTKASDLPIQEFYCELGRRVRSPRFAFMNYGFAEPDDDRAWVLEGDELFGHHLALVRRTVAGADLEGARVVEIGCGRGGNVSYLRRYTGARQVVGVDLNPTNLDLCRSFHRGQDVGFAAGDAQLLPLAGESVDVLVNLESAHCYPDLRAFLGEIHRVLRPGGTFCFADLWDLDLVPHDWAEREATLRAACFEIEEEEDISRGVCLALGEADNVQDLLEAAASPADRVFVERIAATTAHVRRALLFGFARYRRWRMRKVDS
ncbi:MAG: class I SAM-dependent methyltransferase [Acidobacteria bacterium]|nr:class I SAM-dependent methyltransferase [Acidobacteriota bacterium]